MTSQGRVAVVDIGSNTVRMVIFETWRAAILPRFNEKVMAGLGAGLAGTLRLSPTGWISAIKALHRFRRILDGLGVSEVRVVATAAVRVAVDGADFTRQAEAAIGAPVTVLSGPDEGRISALGVKAGFHAPKGLVADLGGSSMELFPVGHAEHISGETHMLGPLAIEHLLDASERDIRKKIRTVIKASDLVSTEPQTLYVVGGAWRSMAKVAMHLQGYPLKVLHAYTLDAKAVSDTVAHIFDVRKADPSMEPLKQAIAGRRSAKLPLSATVLDELMRQSGAKRAVISSMGLREGVVREHLGETQSETLHADPLHDGAAAFLRLDTHQVDFGQALYAFLSHVFEVEAPCFGSRRRDARLYKVACLLADSAGRYHPDHRADMAYEQALWASYAGIDHTERAFVAYAVGIRYRRRFVPPKAHRGLMDDSQKARARQLGRIMRLGAIFSGRSAAILARAKLGRMGGDFTLIVSAGDRDMVSETVVDRHAQAAKELGLVPRIIFR